MIDESLLLDDFDNTAALLSRKGVDIEFVKSARDGIKRRKDAVTKVYAMREAINKTSKEIGPLMQTGQKEAAEGLKQKLQAQKQELAGEESGLEALEGEVRDLLMRVPNLPSLDAPVGKGEDQNVVVRTEGYDPKAYEGKEYKPHWDIAKDLDLYDPERATKISGSGFSLLKGDGARLLDALVMLAKDLNRDTYLQVIPPHFVTTQTFTGTGHLPKFAEDAYHLPADDLWAIPTGEVPLMAMHREEILSADEFPKRYMAYTACFRREAGSAGKDTRGLQRLHEFHKVELVKLCLPEQVEAEFAAMVEDACRPLKLLGIPYRVVDLCTGDLTFSSRRIFDLELYAPGVDKWLEVSSVGDFGDFQARRSNIRFRRGTDRPQPAYALNGSALATPRVWAAILEHYQQPDGTVKVPDVLVPYMGKETIRRRT